MVHLSPNTDAESHLSIPYYTLQIISIVLLVGLLVVFILQSKKRHPTLWNLIISLIVDSAFHCATLGSKGLLSTPLAVLSTVTAISGILATLGCFAAIILRAWVVVVAERSAMVKWESLMNRSLVIVPWAACGLMVDWEHDSLHPENIEATVFGAYNLDDRVPLPPGWTIVACVLQPRLLRGESGDSQISSNARYTHGTSPFDLGFTARVLFFGLYAAVGLVFAVVSLLISSPAPAFYQAVGGIVAVIVFGTQRDILQFLHILPSSDLHLPTTSQALHSSANLRSTSSRKDELAMDDLQSPSSNNASRTSVQTVVTVLKDGGEQQEAGDEFCVEVLQRENARRGRPWSQ
ncbi:hypothetical protein BDY24DRAFT_418550 [Mrakia frigida]|uniref:uncharacterized protein n=1 Tax=Mrakia frigida TaxID=29902 RepID=UPI003FCBFA26